mgnify:CR=1 FL=1
MAKSLQDQLLAAGAVKKDQATRLKKAKHKQARQQQRGAGEPDAIKQAAQRAQAEKQERDRALSRERHAQQERRAIAAQVAQMIETNRLDMDDGETAFNFTHRDVIKSIRITDQQRDALIAGQLAVVADAGSYALIAAPVAEKIRQRDSDTVVLLNDRSSDAALDDDPYADYQIPDDITW